ncbi:MAG: hypothetical protein IT373_20555 [Polyangiaceae bacterium]|nr:hypothetical protein [Polyangiaceae bacterium]
MMRSMIIVTCVAAMALAACGKKKDAANPETTAKPTAEATAAPTAEATAAPTAEATAAPSASATP